MINLIQLSALQLASSPLGSEMNTVTPIRVAIHYHELRHLGCILQVIILQIQGGKDSTYGQLKTCDLINKY